MSQKEAYRLHVMQLLINKNITQKKAADMMKLSKSQTIRVKKAFLQFGIKGLISKRRGKPSPNKISDEILCQVVAIIKKRYSDFGPTFACEKLNDRQYRGKIQNGYRTFFQSFNIKKTLIFNHLLF